ncbi:colony stimulating factor 3 (granulocyte) b [Polymixia lowei]
MNPIHILALQCFLIVLVRSAPLLDSSFAVTDAGFKQATERAKTLVEKILRDIPAVHGATVNTEGLTLDSSSQPTNLQIMVTSLGIPAAPALKPLSERFTLEHCVSRIAVGIQLHQELLGALANKLSGLTDLRADLRDLLTQIGKMQELGRLSSVEQYQSPHLASRLHGDYEVQVASHLTLIQLRSFCHDLVRSLRLIATYRP